MLTFRFEYLLLCLLGCAQKSVTGPVVDSEIIQVPGDAEINETRRETSTGRMDSAAIAALGPVEDSICRAYSLPKELTLNRCEFIGPFQGEIQRGVVGEEAERFEDALLACEADIQCGGVTTTWYLGSKWSPVVNGDSFEIDEDSYGCSFVLSCP
jgi:hypothetical protein